MIHWELYKKLKFDHTNKWFMHNPAAVLENETHKLQGVLTYKRITLISAWRPDLIIINKKKKQNLPNCGLCCTDWPQSKIERKWKEGKVPRPCKGIVEHKSDVYTNCDWCFWYSHQRILKETGGLGNKKTSGDHPNYNTFEIGQNTEKSPGDLRRIAVTQTSVKDYQLTLMWKTPKE